MAPYVVFTTIYPGLSTRRQLTDDKKKARDKTLNDQTTDILTTTVWDLAGIKTTHHQEQTTRGPYCQ
jgi:hypothetical protein